MVLVPTSHSKNKKGYTFLAFYNNNKGILNGAATLVCLYNQQWHRLDHVEGRPHLGRQIREVHQYNVQLEDTLEQQEEEEPKSTKEESSEDEPSNKSTSKSDLPLSLLHYKSPQCRPLSPKQPIQESTMTWIIQMITLTNLPPCPNTFRAHYANFYNEQDLQEEEDHQAMTQTNGNTQEDDGQEGAHPEAVHQEEDPLEAQDMGQT